MSMWFPGGRRVAHVLQPLAGIIHLVWQVWRTRTWLAGTRAPLQQPREAIAVAAWRVRIEAAATPAADVAGSSPRLDRSRTCQTVDVPGELAPNSGEFGYDNADSG
jgi:hypothetical protein